jgi:hypothetical protein
MNLYKLINKNRQRQTIKNATIFAENEMDARRKIADHENEVFYKNDAYTIWLDSNKSDCIYFPSDQSEIVDISYIE